LVPWRISSFPLLASKSPRRIDDNFCGLIPKVNQNHGLIMIWGWRTHLFRCQTARVTAPAAQDIFSFSYRPDKNSS
jgi:hypothetical protein